MSKLLQTIQSSLLYKPRQLNFKIQALLAREPALFWLYQPYIFWSQMKKRTRGIAPHESVVGTHTELVIDGFQGSANSFATVAFQQSQTKPVNLAHHLHSPTQIIRAAKLDKPVLLTVREPEAAILSLTGRWFYISVEQALKSYIGFYGKLTPYLNDCIISTFTQTTQNLDQIVEIINRKYATDFDLVDVNATHASKQKTTDTEANQIKRKQRKQQKSQEFSLPSNQLLLQQANQLYQQFEAQAHQQLNDYCSKL